MSSLTYPKKFGLLGLFGASVIGFLFYVLFLQLNQSIIKSELQLKGIEQLVAINKTIQLAQKYRGYSAAALSTKNTVILDGHLKVEKETERSLTALLASLPVDIILKTGDTDVSDLHNDFLNLHTSRSTVQLEVDFIKHTYLVTQLQLLLKLVAEHYLLITDSELTSYYLIDNLVNNIPEVTESMGQIRAVVTGILTTKILSPSQKKELIKLESRLTQAFHNFEFNLSNVKRHSVMLTETIDSAYSLFNANKDHALMIIQDDIFTKKFSRDPRKFMDDITTEVDSIYGLMYQNFVPMLQAHINNRIIKKQMVLEKAMWMAGLSAFLMVFLMLGFYKSVMNNIHHISKTIKNYSDGNLNARITLDTQDEMREISIAVNTMADNANKDREKISEERERFQILFEKSAYGTVIIENNIFIDCNEKALSMLGYSSKKDLMIMSTDRSPEYQPDGQLSSKKSAEVMAKCMREGSHDFEWLYKKKDGTLFWVHVLFTRVDYSGKQQIHVVWRDINTQVEVKKSLEQKSKQLTFQQRALDEHAIVSITDVAGNITYVNNKFEKISQYTIDELLGQNYQILHAGNHHSDEFYAELWVTIVSGNVWSGEIKNRAKDGSFYWVSSTIVPMMGNDGKPEQYIAIQTDITNVKELERIAIQEKQNADDANQEKSKFLANMSHELRTPMHGILSFSDIGIKNIDTESKENLAQYFSTIQVSGRRLLSLLNDLLDLSKLEAGKMEVNEEESDLAVVFDSCQVEQEQRMHDLGLSLKIIPPTHSSAGFFDTVRIGQVITNILSNAIKFSPENSIITITMDRNDSNELFFSMKDTGVGIPKDELSDVFNAFIQSSKTKTNAGGTGLGLAISKKIIEAHDGKIWAENNRDGGAVFTFTLPQKM